MKTIDSACLFGALFLFLKRGFGFAVVSPSLGAKSGTITATGGGNADVKAAAAADPLVAKLSTTMVTAFKTIADKVIGAINTAAREVGIITPAKSGFGSGLTCGQAQSDEGRSF